jgi:FAD/FMN-containing dehydrogenase
VLVDPDLRFAEVELQPRLLFEDRAIWETVLKLKAQIGSDDPTDRMYADSLGGVLAHELLRLNGNIQSSRGSSPGGLATWQQRSGMNTITAAAGEYSAIISGGARASDVVAVTDPLGLAVVTGSVGAVGVAGLTLGGYGPLIGRFGLALDNLVAAEVVLADGRIVIADRDSEEELFWALRGGGGNFGVVTSMNHRLHRVPSVHSGLLFYPFSEARSVLQACAEIANSASDELTAQVGCVGGLDGPMVFVWVTWCGLPAEGEKRVAPFLNLGP